MVKYTHMNKHEIIKTLQSGICEITYTDSHSVEHSMIGTLSPTHLPNEEKCSNEWRWQSINLFNVNTENWQTISAQSVIDIEQLTGEGAAVNDAKLKASPEYMEQLELFTDQDFDTMKHPEDTTERRKK